MEIRQKKNVLMTSIHIASDTTEGLCSPPLSCLAERELPSFGSSGNERMGRY